MPNLPDPQCNDDYDDFDHHDDYDHQDVPNSQNIIFTSKNMRIYLLSLAIPNLQIRNAMIMMIMLMMMIMIINDIHKRTIIVIICDITIL